MSADAARFARSARLWLRAYPRRWREARGDEPVDLLADLAAPGARRLGARATASTVLAGWRERWRTHPPFGPWLAYRLLDRPLSARYRPWVRDDIRGGGYLLRVAGLPLVFVTPAVVTTDSWTTALVFAGLWLGVAGIAGQRRRRLAARRHLPVRAGEPVDESSVVFGLTMRLRWSARTTWRMWTVLAATAATCGAVGLLVDGDLDGGWSPRVVVVAAAVGGGFALGAARRLRRLVGRLPPQPARWVVAPPRGAVRGAYAWAAVLVVGCVSSLRSGAFVPAALAVAGAALLPVCVVGLWFARRAGDDLAAVDVATIAVRGSAPRVDAYVEGLVPASRAMPTD